MFSMSSKKRQRWTTESVGQYLEEEDYVLIGQFVNLTTKINILCAICGVVYSQVFQSFQRGYRHAKCQDPLKILEKTEKNRRVTKTRKKKQLTCITIKCKYCDLIMTMPKFKPRVVCDSPECRHKCSVDTGKIAAAVTVKRSKNEIHFASLCGEQFTILTNEPIFDGWDADVIIPSIRVCVFWNGIWHYKKVMKSHSLQQSQARDKVKTSVITKKFGWVVYVVKDMGEKTQNLCNNNSLSLWISSTFAEINNDHMFSQIQTKMKKSTCRAEESQGSHRTIKPIYPLPK